MKLDSKRFFYKVDLNENKNNMPTTDSRIYL